MPTPPSAKQPAIVGQSIAGASRREESAANDFAYGEQQHEQAVRTIVAGAETSTHASFANRVIALTSCPSLFGGRAKKEQTSFPASRRLPIARHDPV